MKSWVKWYDTFGTWAKAFSGSFLAGVIFYAGALMRTWIGIIAQKGQVDVLFVHSILALTILVGGAFIVRAVGVLREEIENDRELREAAVMSAYTSVDRVVAERLIGVREATDACSFLERLIGPPRSIQELVKAAYATFERAFGEYQRGPTRIDFEVTFMTKSYKDGEITVAAWSNREGRAPRSMLLRANNSTIYNSTVTAQIYREDRPRIHIVENTKEDYQEIYPGQKDRIKSSLVVPVLSDANELLGTLVIHCDQVGFFKRAEEKYWCDMTEIFSKRLALEKIRLDCLAAISCGERTISTPESACWF